MQAKEDEKRWCIDNLVVKSAPKTPTTSIVAPGRTFSSLLSIRFEAPGHFYAKEGKKIYVTTLECIEKALACLDFIQDAADWQKDISNVLEAPAGLEHYSEFHHGATVSCFERQADNEQAQDYLYFRFVKCPLILEAIQSLVCFFETDQNVVYQHFTFDTTSLSDAKWRPDPREYKSLDIQYSGCATYARTLLRHFFCNHHEKLSSLENIFLYHQLCFCHIYPVVCVYEFETVYPLDTLQAATKRRPAHQLVAFLERYYQKISEQVFDHARAFLVAPSEFIPQLHLKPCSTSTGTKGWGFSRPFTLFDHFTKLQRQGKEFGLTHELLHQHKLVYPTPLHDFCKERKRAKRGDPSARTVLRIDPLMEKTKRWFVGQWKKNVTEEKSQGVDRIGTDEFVCLIYYYLNRSQRSLVKLDSLSHEVRKISNGIKPAVARGKHWHYLRSTSKMAAYLSIMRAEMGKMQPPESHSTFYNKFHHFASSCLSKLN